MPTAKPFSSATATTRLAARAGDALRHHPRAIARLQWIVVALYALLLLAPLILPLPTNDDHILTHARLFAQFLFWGIGWPAIFLSMMLLGRVWCGLFCPDGTLTEWISHHGRKQSIPRWMRWTGWPLTMLIVTTVYGQLVGVYDLHWGTLLLLGLPTLGALWCGYAYGNGRRIWCMYLCPANGPFSLLSKIALLHFRVDETKWKQVPPPLPRVDCPTLIDIRRMKSTSACHQCGRCSGYLNAVELAVRAPDSEIRGTTNQAIRTADALTLLFGLLGVCTLAVGWTTSPWFDKFKMGLAQFSPAALHHYGAPWWVLAHHPQEHYVFTLFDGGVILLYLLGGGAALGLALMALLKITARIAAVPDLSWQHLSLALIPVAGLGLFLGLSSFTVTHLRREGFSLTWVPVVQQTMLLLGSAFSLWLGAKLILTVRSPRQWAAWLGFAATVGLATVLWLQKLTG